MLVLKKVIQIEIKKSNSINNDICSLGNGEHNYKKYLIDKDNCKSKAYDEIKMKLNAQE